MADLTDFPLILWVPMADLTYISLSILWETMVDLTDFPPSTYPLFHLCQPNSFVTGLSDAPSFLPVLVGGDGV